MLRRPTKQQCCKMEMARHLRWVTVSRGMEWTATLYREDVRARQRPTRVLLQVQWITKIITLLQRPPLVPQTMPMGKDHWLPVTRLHWNTPRDACSWRLLTILLNRKIPIILNYSSTLFIKIVNGTNIALRFFFALGNLNNVLGNCFYS